MFNFKEHLGPGVNHLHAIFNDEWFETRQNIVGETVIVLPPEESEPALVVAFWLLNQRRYCRITKCAAVSPKPQEYSVPDGDSWESELVEAVTNSALRARVVLAMTDWLLGSRKYLQFTRIPRATAQTAIITVRGGVYREADRADEIKEWSTDAIANVECVEYWIAMRPDGSDHLFMFYDRDIVPYVSDDTLSWVAFEIDEHSAPLIDETEYAADGELSLTVTASGSWTRMRTLYVDYLEIYDHAEGFEYAGALLQMLKAAICASGRDVSE